jgi:hypothetical protein
MDGWEMDGRVDELGSVSVSVRALKGSTDGFRKGLQARRM